MTHSMPSTYAGKHMLGCWGQLLSKDKACPIYTYLTMHLKASLLLPLLPHIMKNRFVLVQANTVPATFWALAFLLLPDNALYKRHILSSLQSDGSHAGSQTPVAQQQGMDDAGEPLPVSIDGASDRSFSAPHHDPSCACISCQCLMDWGSSCIKSHTGCFASNTGLHAARNQ